MVKRLQRILIAEDHEAVARELARVVSAEVAAVDIVQDGDLVVATAMAQRPDVVLLDLSLPHVHGFELLQQLTQLGLEFKIIVVTMYADATVAAAALKRGASGFVVKSTIGDELLSALDVVVSGETYLARDLRDEITGLMFGAADPTNVDVTAEQWEILRLIARGRRASEIASTLGIPASNVVAVKNDMMKRFGVQSTAELAKYAIHHHLVEN